MPGNATAVQLMTKLRDHLPDLYTMEKFNQLEMAMMLWPMKRVLARVEGETVIEKAKRVGVSRNTWYAWERGVIRPTKKQAKRLERLTGIVAERFQGRR